MRLIAQNPVAAARFFDHMTQAFIEHVLCVDSNDPGLYGHTDSYYGTVEQQGRLTLHMHMLIWVKGALSPQEIRQKMMSEDGEFQKAMIAYLEVAHVGEFLTGTMAEVRAKVPYLPKRRQGMHDIIADDSAPSTPAGYTDPTQTVPEAPPPLCDDWADCENLDCNDCESSSRWRDQYREAVDDLILRSNVHDCRRPFTGTDLSKPLQPGARIRQEV
jgi:hypothetical protein